MSPKNIVTNAIITALESRPDDFYYDDVLNALKDQRNKYAIQLGINFEVYRPFQMKLGLMNTFRLSRALARWKACRAERDLGEEK